MFKNLTDLGYKRTFVQALGFYLAYLLLGIILGGLLGGVAGAVLVKENTFQAGFAVGAKVGLGFSIIYTVVLSFLVLKNKKLMGNFGYLILTLLSGVLAVFGGGLLGLIPTAYLTTRNSK